MLGTLIFLDGYFCLLIKDVVELHQTENHRWTAFLVMGVPVLPMASAGFFCSFSERLLQLQHHLWPRSSLESSPVHFIHSVMPASSTHPRCWSPLKARSVYPLQSPSNAAALVESSIYPATIKSGTRSPSLFIRSELWLFSVCVVDS